MPIFFHNEKEQVFYTKAMVFLTSVTEEQHDSYEQMAS
jgi:hypothetical protein